MVNGHPNYSKFHLKFESTKYTDRWTWSESQHLIIIFLDAWHCSVLCHCLHYIVFDRRWFLYIHLPSPKCSQIMKVRGMSKAKSAENGPKGKIPCFSWPGVEAKNLWVDEWSLKCKTKTYFQLQSFITPAHFTLQMICEIIFSYLKDIFYSSGKYGANVHSVFICFFARSSHYQYLYQSSLPLLWHTFPNTGRANSF